MTRAETFQLRTQLLELLRTAGRPVSSAELAGMLPWSTERLDLGCELLCLAPRHQQIEIVECHRTWHIVRRPRSSQDAANGIYRHLRSLAHQGAVRRVTLGQRRVAWEHIPPDGSVT